MAKTKKTLREVLDAIDGTGGIKKLIAARLGVQRSTVDSYLKRWKAAQLFYAHEVESVADQAESVLKDSIDAGDVGSAKWYLARVRKGKYSERTEHTGADAGALVVKMVSLGGIDPEKDI